MAVPVRVDLIAQIDSLARRQLSCWARGLDNRRTELRAAARALPGADELLAVPRQKLDALSERLPRALKANAEIHHKEFLKCATKLAPQLLRGRVRAEQERVGNLIARARRCTQVHRDKRRQHFAAVGGRLDAAVRSNIAAHRQRIVRDRERIAALFERGAVGVARLIERRFASLERADRLLAAFSYQGVLARGFALVREPGGPPIRSAAAVSTGQALDIEFADGRVAATATEAHGRPVKPRQPIRPRSRRSGGGEGQGSLF
jgi:exodeoxyribonuclease VII large subunit